MSASLRGLGDVYKRQETPPTDPPPGRGDLLGLLRARGGSSGGSLGGLPVSYTHLTLPTICSV
eukprot:3466509-Alexandrium_andersonii.AAC.1